MYFMMFPKWFWFGFPFWPAGCTTSRQCMPRLRFLQSFRLARENVVVWPQLGQRHFQRRPRRAVDVTASQRDASKKPGQPARFSFLVINRSDFGWRSGSAAKVMLRLEPRRKRPRFTKSGRVCRALTVRQLVTKTTNERSAAKANCRKQGTDRSGQPLPPRSAQLEANRQP